jgi:hypothetical protein
VEENGKTYVAATTLPNLGLRGCVTSTHFNRTLLAILKDQTQPCPNLGLSGCVTSTHFNRILLAMLKDQTQEKRWLYRGEVLTSER